MLNWSGPGPGGNAGQARRRTLVLVDRRVAERAPHPLERAGVGVEHDRRGDCRSRRRRTARWSAGAPRRPPAGAGCVVSALPLLGELLADLQHELAVLRELHQLVVADRLRARAARGRRNCCRRPRRSPCGRCGCRARAAGHSTAALGAAPALMKLPAASNTRIAGAALPACSGLSVRGRCSTQILSCASTPMLEASPSFHCGGTFGQARIDLEHRHAARWRLRRLSGSFAAEQPDRPDPGHDDRREHSGALRIRALHDVLPC